MSSTLSDFRSDIRSIQSLPQAAMILDVCARVTGMGFVAIARVTETNWVTCASRDTLGFGLAPGDELPVDSTICNEIRASRTAVVIDDVAHSALYCDHHTPRTYGFRSYISYPIVRRDGSFFGTLCAIDPEPRDLSTPETQQTFRLFADLVASLLDTEALGTQNREDLERERQTARLREEFIAVVGHDLNNPVAAIRAGLRMLERGGLDAPQHEALMAEMKRTVLRMTVLVGNLLDFARGRLGDGIKAERDRPVDLVPVIEGVTEEIRRVARQPVELDLALPEPVHCDPQRIGQLVSNLLGNAMTHGAAEAPIRVVGEKARDRLRITVSNAGEQIPPDLLPSLFQPFSRGTLRPNQAGLGLGLYISDQIARAHGGELRAVSTTDRTDFVFEMPWA